MLSQNYDFLYLKKNEVPRQAKCLYDKHNCTPLLWNPVKKLYSHICKTLEAFGEVFAWLEEKIMKPDWGEKATAKLGGTSLKSSNPRNGKDELTSTIMSDDDDDDVGNDDDYVIKSFHLNLLLKAAKE